MLAKRFGIEITRLSTHRSLNLFYDIRRIGVPKVPMLFDVGANIGEFTHAWRAWFPQSKVIAFEPVPHTFATLHQRYRDDDSIKCVNAAVGNFDGKVKMTAFSGKEAGNNRIVANPLVVEESIPQIEIDQLTVESFCKALRVDRIDFLKTDCEGFDLYVLEGARALFIANRVGAVYCEVDFVVAGTHGSFIAIDTFLREMGFICCGFFDYSNTGVERRQSFTNALWLPLAGNT
jgi:FkbM family methyltransferase